MSLLRIRGSIAAAPARCQWALVNEGREPVTGEGMLAELPRRADRIQLVIPAAQVLITCARLPQAARRHAGAVLAYAVEDKIAGEPDTNQVSWLGVAGDSDVLAVVDKAGLLRWRNALDACGIREYEIHCETLLLPQLTDAWSLAWNGREGIVRTGEFEGTVTDCGDRETPPLSLRMMLEEAQTRSAKPASIALYMTATDALPNIEAWTRALGIAVHPSGNWDWRSAPTGAGVSLARQRRRWRVFSGTADRLRPAAWILGAALAIQAVALVIDWTLLANEQRALRQNMEERFRAAFPDAVAVADPALQMRRKLAEARHAAGQADAGDFLPMIVHVAAAAKELPAGTVRTVSYESGRMTLELSAVDEASLRHIVARLTQSGLIVGKAIHNSSASKGKASTTTILTVRSS